MPIPDRPSLDGIEARWAERWQEDAVYRFDRSRPRDDVYAIDTPPPTVSGSLHLGSVFSYTHTDLLARYQRMRGKAVFYPMGWDDNGLPTERRVETYFGVRCDPSLPYEQGFTPPGRPGGELVRVSRRTFIELCHRLTEMDEQSFAALWRQLGLSVDWSLAYATIDEGSRAAAQRAFLRNLARQEAYQAEAPTVWDVTLQTAVAQAELEDRVIPGAAYRLAFPPCRPGGDPVEVETTRPELLPACVGVVVHPMDRRYRSMVGATVTTPLFGVEVPVHAHPLADPEKGTGAVMVCTFGDLTDVTWWRELDLPARTIVTRAGRIAGSPPPGMPEPGRSVYAELAGLTVAEARTRTGELLRDAGGLRGEPRPIEHAVKFYERGEVPVEIVSSRQWYLRNGARDPALREALLERGRRLAWHPAHMGVRYEHWVGGLVTDWVLSRQRYFGVPFPVWYRLDEDGEAVFEQPLLASEASLPVDPSIDAPPGYEERRRGRPGGFAGDPDVMDTWATSSLTPQIAGGWERDPDLFPRVFPMDLRPQAHEIIRTWLFTTVLRSHLEEGVLPWRHAVISGWVVDPDRKKMSKSKGTAQTPSALLERYGSDGVRYWAARAHPGVDTAVDESQMRVGRRLALKILNASRFVLGTCEGAIPAAVDAPLDRAMLAGLATAAARATDAFDHYDWARALEEVEAFFWSFCDDYLELVKARAYGDLGDGPAASARRALLLGLRAQLRLLAPFLPFATEEAWSWWQEGSIHRAGWPDADELRALAGGADERALEVAAAVIAAVRKAKTAARVGMRADVSHVRVSGEERVIDSVRAVLQDVASAGRVRAWSLSLAPGAPLSAEVEI